MEKTATVQHNPHKERALDLRRAVLNFLECTEMDYNSFQYRCGLNYLKHYLNGDLHAIDMISASAKFWAWWRNHWTNRDQGFVEHVINTCLTTEQMREIYDDLHDARTLARAIYPNGIILNESYAKMITQLIQQETQKP